MERFEAFSQVREEVIVLWGEKGRDREIFEGAGIWGGSGSQSRCGWVDLSGMKVHGAGAWSGRRPAEYESMN